MKTEKEIKLIIKDLNIKLYNKCNIIDKIKIKSAIQAFKFVLDKN